MKQQDSSTILFPSRKEEYDKMKVVTQSFIKSLVIDPQFITEDQNSLYFEEYKEYYSKESYSIPYGFHKTKTIFI